MQDVADGIDWDQRMPLDVLAAVAGGRNDLKAMRLVCHGWQAGFERSVSSITVSRKGALLPEAASLAQRFPWLSSLDIGDSQMDESFLGQLNRLPRLRTLTLGRSSVLRGSESSFAERLTDTGLKSLWHLPVTSLDLNGCEAVTDAGLKHLYWMGQLKTLNLSGMVNITTKGLFITFVISCHLISSLSLGGCDLKSVYEDGLQFVLRWKPLTSLDIEDCPLFSDLEMSGLRGKALISLSLGRSWTEPNLVTDAGLENLAGMPLTHLDLMGSTHITGSGFSHLQGTPLASLNLAACREILDSSLALLRGLPLTNLDLQECTLVTDVGLAHLHGMPLARLDLAGCWGVTQAGVAELHRAIDVRSGHSLFEFLGRKL